MNVFVPKSVGFFLNIISLMYIIRNEVIGLKIINVCVCVYHNYNHSKDS